MKTNKQTKIKLIVLLILLSNYINDIHAQTSIIEELCLTQNKASDRYASFSPDGQKILFESDRDGDWNIYLMDADGKNQQALTRHDSTDRRPSWHPSGKKILFESNRGGKMGLYTLHLKSKKINTLAHGDQAGIPIFASYSPNGKQIALSLQYSDTKIGILLLNKKGKLIRPLMDNNWRNVYPRWSGDGKEIVFFSRKDTENQDDEIYKMDLQSGTEVRLTNWPKHNFCPSWSFDQQRIAYVTSMEGTRPEIYIMNADGTKQTRLTNNTDGETLPNWAPHKNSLLITAYRVDNYEICELILQANK